MSAEESKSAVRRYFELLNAGEVDKLDTVLAPSHVDHYDPSGSVGPDPEKEFVRMVRTAFPDASWTIEDIIAEEDTAAVRVTFRGTQQAEFLGIAPRGKTVAMPAMAFIRIVDGKLAETWLLRDRPTLIAQLTA